MKITVYTVSDCLFSKQEKEYLIAHNLQFEEKNLETNKDFLTEMLAVGDNFAGTPLTRIEKDDGQAAVLKGFTLEEFDEVLGFKKPEETAKSQEELAAPTSTPVTAQPTTITPIPSAPTLPPTDQQPSISAPPPIPTVIEPPQSVSPSPALSDLPQSPASQEPVLQPPNPAAANFQPATPPQSNPIKDEKLSSVLNNLESIANKSDTTTNNPNPTPPPNMPSIPDPKFG